MRNPDKRRDEILLEFMELVTPFLTDLLHIGDCACPKCSGVRKGISRLRELIQQYHDDVIDPQRGEVEDVKGR